MNILPIKPTFLITDLMLILFFILIIKYYFNIKREPNLLNTWQNIFKNKLYNTAGIIFMIFFAVAILDSIHFNKAVTQNGQIIAYSNKVTSAFDVIIGQLGQQMEKSYSKPFATHLLDMKYEQDNNGKFIQYQAELEITKNNPSNIKIALYVIQQALIALIFCSTIFFTPIILKAYCNKESISIKSRVWQRLKQAKESKLLHAVCTASIIIVILNTFLSLSNYFHIFGTNKVGSDVFYQAIKSIRTGIIIGCVTTMFSLPLAITMGISAGYFGKKIDDLIQYIYITISAIPSILLIAAAILSLQIWLDKHNNWFNSMAASADARLLLICFILGITGWTSLCRMLRGETLKIRELDFINAAKTMGVKKYHILFRHILPNLMHIILIYTVIEFSGLVLAEAVLSYIGIGVAGSTNSWGNMINSARLELARDPAIWWSLSAAFIFMFTLVLAANIFADGVREAFDPRAANRER